MDLGLSGQTALITGGSKGIGFATAAALLAEGCSVILAARSSKDLQSARSILEQRFKKLPAVFGLDSASEDNRIGLLQAHEEVDILINCAGAIPGGAIDAVNSARWREAWDSKVFGYIDLTRAYYARMKQRKRGVIVNVIGIAGERPDAHYIAGCAGNAALISFTKALGGTSLYDGVRVVGVNPGPVSTQRLINLQKGIASTKFGDENRWPELFSALPMQRAATPEEIADTIAFLASERSSYTSGTVVNVDGGLSGRNPLI